MISSQHREWLKRFLTDADICRLEGVSVWLAPERSLGLISLLDGWRKHVQRIESEGDLPDSDRTVWGAYDLIAALALRSAVAQGVKNAGADSIGGFREALEDVDSRFRGFTEVDESGVVRRIDGGGRANDEWWWDRVPRIGPIRRELEQIRSSF